ncbi:MAG: altronate dehydratase [Bacteroidetes bacterium]|nr:MAG: altronate dehydratase [Bacteroidota bacterium]
MMQKILHIHPDDNLAVALRDLAAGTEVTVAGRRIKLRDSVAQKHKFTLEDLGLGSDLQLYGVLVGRTTQALPAGSLIGTSNTRHAAAQYQLEDLAYTWQAPDTQAWQGDTFLGFHRNNGQVGTRNYWLIVPLVFCENRNIEVLRRTLDTELGYASAAPSWSVAPLLAAYQQGASPAEISRLDPTQPATPSKTARPFPQVDGIKYLLHDGGCGGTRTDSETLCRLLAGYIVHPNVAGATVLSLGCQNAQIPLLQEAITALDAHFDKPVHYLEQQALGTEDALLRTALQVTVAGCAEANNSSRAEAPLSALTLGLECGGSDGFSGLSANPALGHTSDLLVALGAKAILAEFPELNGVEQELIRRCQRPATAQRFAELMQTYARRAREVGSDFAWNPSPGNIRDGLITDAMKSAGAARKGGSSPIVDVLDYTELATRPGLNLLCTPGNDVESTTGLAASGATLIAFTTGLGTPTGNPIAPTLKIASNSELASRMPDLIDLDAGEIIRGKRTVEEIGTQLLNLMICTASGNYLTKAERLQQDDFIPWKRGISL